MYGLVPLTATGMLDKLPNWVCRTTRPSVAASLAASHRRNVAKSRLYYRYYFGIYSSELAKLVHLPYLF